jgi:hypothetical protein
MQLSSNNVRFRGNSGHGEFRGSRPLLTQSGHQPVVKFVASRIDRVLWIERAITPSYGARMPKLIEARVEPTV